MPFPCAKRQKTKKLPIKKKVKRSMPTKTDSMPFQNQTKLIANNARPNKANLLPSEVNVNKTRLDAALPSLSFRFHTSLSLWNQMGYQMLLPSPNAEIKCENATGNHNLTIPFVNPSCQCILFLPFSTTPPKEKYFQ